MKRFPMDIDELKYGTTITPAEIEQIMSADRTKEKEYRLKQLALKHWIERTIYKERGVRVTMECRGEALVILEHEAASRKNPSLFKRFLRGAGRAARRNRDVDPSGFAQADKNRHERNVLTHGRVLSAIRRAWREPILPITVARAQLPAAAKSDDAPAQKPTEEANAEA